jgi:hypothetical protein
MDFAHPGLMDTLRPDWGGGVCARVITPATIPLGAPVALTSHSRRSQC